MTSEITSFRTLDGLHLAGTLVLPDQTVDRAVVLVHGGGVTREEGGFFTRLADGLGATSVASLRYDLRGHGESEGRQEENVLTEDISLPTLIVHGTKDTFVLVESSRQAATRLQAEHELVEIDGAQHGFAVHEDPQYLNPQSQEWQAFVIQTVITWLTRTAETV